MKPLAPYQVLRPVDGKPALIAKPCRYLARDATSGYSALIQLEFTSSIAVPFLVLTEELVDQIGRGSISQSIFYPLGLPVSTDSLPEQSRHYFKLLWDVFEPEFVPDRLHRMIFDTEYRKLYLERLAPKVPSIKNIKAKSQVGVSYWQCERHFLRFLWAGGNPLSLAPNYRLGGAPGKEQQTLTANGEDASKRGRKGTSEVPLPENRELLKKGAKKYFSKKNFTLRMSYWHTLAEFFPGSGFWNKDSRGARFWDLYDKAGVPSLWQFRYVAREMEATSGAPRQQKMHARLEATIVGAIKNSPKRHVFMPGERVEIDASKLQIKVASSLARDRILKPLTPYIGVDCMSGAAIGYALSSEEPSLKISLDLLDNCMMPKGPVFQRLGLPYTDADWPSFLPSILGVDRGELAANKAVHVVAGGCVIKVMPAMMSNWKGVVENRWGQIKERFARSGTAGVHSKIVGRRQNDGIKSSCLIPIEAERRFVQLLMDINNESADPKLIPPEMIQDPGVRSISKIELMKWGLIHRPGATRELTEQERIDYLMMRDTGAVTTHGILYKKLTFISDHLHASGLTTVAASGRIPIAIRYRENIADWIWFRDPISNEWTPAEIDNQNLVNRKITFAEAISHIDTVTALTVGTNDSAAVAAIEHEREAVVIESSARKKAAAARKASGATKSSMKKNRRENSALETELKRSIADADLRSHVHGIKNERKVAIKNETAPVQLPRGQADDEPFTAQGTSASPSAADIALRLLLEMEDE